MDSRKNAAKRLLGMKLDGGWVVAGSVEKTGSQTGSFFSQGYVARNEDGTEAFLKAMDFSEASTAPDFARAIEQLARQFNFERDILEFCKERRMRNVVRSIGGGIVDVVGDGNPLNRVQYFLFEPADGDIRKMIDSFDEVTLAWAMKVAHESAVGMRQLHGAFIAHQDFKPSNILSFDQSNSIKVGDLGCASMRGEGCPRDSLGIPGQMSYAPPEQLYGYLSPDWIARRVGSDMYQLGAVSVFLIAGLSVNSLLAEKIDQNYLWTKWQGTYEEALPFIRAAFGRVLETISPAFSGPGLDELFEVIKELCEPDLAKRGDPRRIKRGGAQYSIDPYVSRLGALRRSAEVRTKRLVLK